MVLIKLRERSFFIYTPHYHYFFIRTQYEWAYYFCSCQMSFYPIRMKSQGRSLQTVKVNIFSFTVCIIARSSPLLYSISVLLLFIHSSITLLSLSTFFIIIINWIHFCHRTKILLCYIVTIAILLTSIIILSNWFDNNWQLVRLDVVWSDHLTNPGRLVIWSASFN